MAKKRTRSRIDAPQRHGDHPRPVTRRQFVAQGFLTGVTDSARDIHRLPAPDPPPLSAR